MGALWASFVIVALQFAFVFRMHASDLKRPRCDMLVGSDTRRKCGVISRSDCCLHPHVFANSSATLYQYNGAQGLDDGILTDVAFRAVIEEDTVYVLMADDRQKCLEVVGLARELEDVGKEARVRLASLGRARYRLAVASRAVLASSLELAPESDLCIQYRNVEAIFEIRGTDATLRLAAPPGGSSNTQLLVSSACVTLFSDACWLNCSRLPLGSLRCAERSAFSSTMFQLKEPYKTVLNMSSSVSRLNADMIRSDSSAKTAFYCARVEVPSCVAIASHTIQVRLGTGSSVRPVAMTQLDTGSVVIICVVSAATVLTAIISVYLQRSLCIAKRTTDAVEVGLSDSLMAGAATGGEMESPCKAVLMYWMESPVKNGLQLVTRRLSALLRCAGLEVQDLYCDLPVCESSCGRILSESLGDAQTIFVFVCSPEARAAIRRVRDGTLSACNPWQRFFIEAVQSFPVRLEYSLGRVRFLGLRSADVCELFREMSDYSVGIVYILSEPDRMRELVAGLPGLKSPVPDELLHDLRKSALKYEKILREDGYEI